MISCMTNILLLVVIVVVLVVEIIVLIFVGRLFWVNITSISLADFKGTHTPMHALKRWRKGR